MGALLEPTAVMGPWHVEVRRESARLLGDDPNWTPADGAPPEHTVRVLGNSPDGEGFAIPVDDRDAVRAAVVQVTEHPAYVAWATQNDPSDAVWRTQTVDGWLRLFGPVIVYGAEEPWRVAGAVELEYRHLAALLGALSAAQR